jgi:PAP2 superfamily
MSCSSKAAFQRDLLRRVKAQFWLKTFGVSAFMVLFFWGYIYILKHAYFPVTVMPLLAIDRFIPYQNSAWLLYVSLWIYVQLPVMMLDTRRKLVRFGAWSAGLSVIGFVFFILWPTAVPAVGDVGDGALFTSIRSIDTTGNSCPSLHVAFSVFTAVWLELFLRRVAQASWARFLNVIWCLGIVYSTLATKQHVMLDACAGAVLGFIGAAAQAYCENRYRENEAVPELVQINPATRKL